jgi:hypothetical protein
MSGPQCRCGCCRSCITDEIERAKQLKSCPISYSFSLADRYGAPFEQLKPPDGYEFTGEFRPLHNRHESWHNPGMEQSDGRPVLILRPRPKRKRIIFEETDRQLDNRFDLFAQGGAVFFLDGTYLKLADTNAMRKLSVGDASEDSKRFTRREEEF